MHQGAPWELDPDLSGVPGAWITTVQSGEHWKQDRLIEEERNPWPGWRGLSLHLQVPSPLSPPSPSAGRNPPRSDFLPEIPFLRLLFGLEPCSARF